MTPADPPIELPRSGLVVLIGPSSAGKSTWATRHAGPTEILSSDAFRALVSDDPSEQDATLDAFDVPHLVAARRMAHRRLSVVDATNVEGWARGRLLELARAHALEATARGFSADQIRAALGAGADPLAETAAEALGPDDDLEP